MKIIVPIATRSRPMRLAGVLHSLTVLASGKNAIHYVIRRDADDDVMAAFEASLACEFQCSVVSMPRPISLGQSWNEAVSLSSYFEWDACAVIADKHLCMTRNWDEGIREVIETNAMPAARWSLMDKDLETVLILSRKWYDTTGQIFPEWFPFWFSERWVVEVHHLAFGIGIPRITNMNIAEPDWKTQNLRDLEFWFDFFAKTRVLRIAEARKIAAAFGRIMPSAEPIIAEMRRADAWQTPRIAGYYETRGAPSGPPSEEYKIAKARAEAWLTENMPMEIA